MLQFTVIPFTFTNVTFFCSIQSLIKVPFFLVVKNTIDKLSIFIYLILNSSFQQYFMRCHNSYCWVVIHTFIVLSKSEAEAEAYFRFLFSAAASFLFNSLILCLIPVSQCWNLFLIDYKDGMSFLPSFLRNTFPFSTLLYFFLNSI